MSNVLGPGGQLTPGQDITSPNNGYKLLLQNDGNLVLYRLIDNHALWATGTNGQNVVNALMQNDGNFVLYLGNGSPCWASNTEGKPGSFLTLQNDGNVVIYWPNCPVWATNTSST
jgi:hypothetical protein